MANDIVKLFENIIEESGFEDLEQVKDDIEDQDINNSQISLHIISNLGTEDHQLKVLIHDGIKAIINDDIDKVLKIINGINRKREVDDEKQNINVCSYN